MNNRLLSGLLWRVAFAAGFVLLGGAGLYGIVSLFALLRGL